MRALMLAKARAEAMSALCQKRTLVHLIRRCLAGSRHIALLGNYHSQPMSNPLSVSFKCPNCKARGSFLPAPPEHQRRLLCEFTDKLGNWRPFY